MAKQGDPVRAEVEKSSTIRKDDGRTVTHCLGRTSPQDLGAESCPRRDMPLDRRKGRLRDVSIR